MMTSIHTKQTNKQGDRLLSAHSDRDTSKAEEETKAIHKQAYTAHLETLDMH